MKVSVFIAASGRPDMLDNMLDSLAASTNWARGDVELETIFVIEDDAESFNVATNFPAYDGQMIEYLPTRRGALNAWNRALQLSTGDILVPAGDDQIFHANWLEYALDAHRTHCKGFGVVGMNDLAYNGNTQVATMWLFDRKYCQEIMGGIFAPPMYHYYCVDLEWNEKAKMLSHFYWEEKSIVEHLHSAHGKRPVDLTDGYKDAMWMEIDNLTFESRKAEGFPVTWNSII